MRSLRIIGSLGLILIFFQGCVEDNSSVFISHSSIFEYDETAGCVANPGVRLSRAELNIAFPDNSYDMAAVVVSQLVRRNIATTAEPNGLYIERFEVELSDESGAVLVPRYSVIPTGGGYIPPSAIGGSEQAVYPVTIIPRGVTSILRDYVEDGGSLGIVAHLRAFGRTTAGTQIKSAGFNFGLTLVDEPDNVWVYCPAVTPRADLGPYNCTSGQDGHPFVLTSCGD